MFSRVLISQYKGKGKPGKKKGKQLKTGKPAMPAAPGWLENRRKTRKSWKGKGKRGKKVKNEK